MAGVRTRSPLRADEPLLVRLADPVIQISRAQGNGAVSDRSIRKVVTRNAAASVLGRVWYIGVWIAATPFVLNKLGDERFGVWALLFLLSGYLATFDLGLGPAMVKFTAQHAASRDWAALERTAAGITRAYIVMGVIWVLVVFGLADPIVALLRISPEYQTEVRVTILFSVVVFAVANLISSGTGILNGLQRMDLSNGILVVASVPQLVVLVIGLQLGYGLYAVVWSTAAQWLCSGVAVWLVLRRIAPALKWPSVRSAGPHAGWLGFSVAMQVANLIVFAQLNVDKIVIAALAGVSAVTEFELGYRLANGVQSLPVLALAPLVPVFADLHARRSDSRFREIWLRSTEGLAFGSIGITCCAVLVAPLLVRAWLGPGHADAEVLAQWLLVGLAINLMTGSSTAAARGSGNALLELGPGVLALLVHVAVSWALLQAWGVRGVGPAFCLAYLTWMIFYQWRFSRWSGLRFKEFVDALAEPVASAALVIPLGVLLLQWIPVGWERSRLTTFITAAGLATALGVAYAAVWAVLRRVRGRPSLRRVLLGVPKP